jgi:hypothetical protein
MIFDLYIPCISSLSSHSLQTDQYLDGCSLGSLESFRKKNTKAAPCAEIGPTQTILSEAVENVNACGRGCQAILAGGLQCSIVQSWTLHTGITVSLSTNLRIVVSPSFRLSYPCIDPSSFQPSVETVRRPLTVSDLATRPIHLPVI